MKRAAASPDVSPYPQHPGSFNPAITSDEIGAMGYTNDMQARCAEMLATLAQEWHLAPERQAAYLRAIVAYIPPHCTEGQLQRLILCYHHDHQEVQALSDPHDPGYHEAWNSWHR